MVRRTNEVTMNKVWASAVTLLLIGGGPAAVADEAQCRELRDAGYDACNRDYDAQRALCAGRCLDCGREVSTCVAYCDHTCDAPLFEGCGFDLSGCVTRCDHRRHDPGCIDNPSCRAWWSSKDHLKSCVDACQATYHALAGCRADWCEEGKARKSCLDGCGTERKLAASCRLAWCGDGAAVKQCYADVEKAEDPCRKQTETDYQTCLVAKRTK